jgi:hypothetical protein
MLDRPVTEPSADHRRMAAHMWQTFAALREAGFTDGQTMYLLGTMLEAMMTAADDDE